MGISVVSIKCATCPTVVGLIWDEVRERYWCGECLLAQVEHLQEVVDKQPKCWRLGEDGKRVQDVPIAAGMEIWWVLGRTIHRDVVRSVGKFAVLIIPADGPDMGREVSLFFGDCSSTRAAVEAAKEK